MTRSCGTCTMCCKVLRVATLHKPPGQWCQHCAAGQGCTIYETRPGECAAFSCVWLSTPGLGEEWLPAKCKIVLVYDERNNHLVAHVEAANAAVLNKSPYREKLRDWMQAGLPRGGRVYFAIGSRLHVTWLGRKAASLAAGGAWQRRAAEAMAADLAAKQADLARRVIAGGGPDPVAAWLERRKAALARLDALVAELRAAPSVDLAALTVASRELRGLLQG